MLIYTQDIWWICDEPGASFRQCWNAGLFSQWNNGIRGPIKQNAYCATFPLFFYLNMQQVWPFHFCLVSFFSVLHAQRDLASLVGPGTTFLSNIIGHLTLTYPWNQREKDCVNIVKTPTPDLIITIWIKLFWFKWRCEAYFS